MVKERRNRPAIVNIAGLFLHPLLREGAMHACAATRGSGQQSDSASDGGNTGPPVAPCHDESGASAIQPSKRH